jgi:hypothetical protein
MLFTYKLLDYMNDIDMSCKSLPAKKKKHLHSQGKAGKEEDCLLMKRKQNMSLLAKLTLLPLLILFRKCH